MLTLFKLHLKPNFFPSPKSRHPLNKCDLEQTICNFNCLQNPPSVLVQEMKRNQFVPLSAAGRRCEVWSRSFVSQEREGLGISYWQFNTFH